MDNPNTECLQQHYNGEKSGRAKFLGALCS